MEGGRFGGDNFSASNGYSINISGGNVTVQANGDGLDSNGSINISGGNVVSLINAKGDGAIDANGTIEFTGGTIIYGGTGIGGAPGGNSTQSYVYMDVNVPANSEISVQNSGKTLIAFTPFLDCRYLVLSSPDIKSGESYEIYSGAVLITAATAGTGGGGMGGGGMGGGGMGGGGMGGGGTSGGGMGGGGMGGGGMGGGGMGGGERQPPNMNRQRPE
ncbi:MAG: carbohydrate-binding domain-containing protein [Clostridiales Family XIII bacterium]|jgi:hypothetical protein|nr:carbohydrate-binding domain-containing protein [Clostridiales Family XIII bacterium]